MTITIGMYQYIAEKKIRFQSSRGPLSLENLYDLQLTNPTGVSLDQVAMTIQDEIDDLQAGNKSFVETDNKNNAALKLAQMKLEIVVDLIEKRKAEREAFRDSVAKQQQRRQLQDLLAQKELEARSNMTIDQIKDELAKLDEPLATNPETSESDDA